MDKFFLLNLVNVRKSYHPESGTVSVLRGINLSVERGQTVAITGPSGSGKSTLLNLIGALDIWTGPIRLDPKWHGGDYYDSEPPIDGFREAMKMTTLFARHWEWADETFGRAWAEEDKDPAAAFENKYQIQVALDDIAKKRAANADANHFLYLAKANQNFVVGHKGSLAKGLAAIESPTLLIYAEDDLLFFPEQILQTKALIQADGTPAESVELSGKLGHVDGIASIGQASEAIVRFLAK